MRRPVPLLLPPELLGDGTRKDGGQSARPGLGTITIQRDEREEPAYYYPDDGTEPILVEGGWAWP